MLLLLLVHRTLFLVRLIVNFMTFSEFSVSDFLSHLRKGNFTINFIRKNKESPNRAEFTFWGNCKDCEDSYEGNCGGVTVLLLLLREITGKFSSTCA